MQRLLLIFILIVISKLAWGQTGVTATEKETNSYLFKAVDFDNWLWFEDGPCDANFNIKVTYENNVSEVKYERDIMPGNYQEDNDWYININDLQFSFLIEKKIKSITMFYYAKEQPESGRCHGVNATERSHERVNSNLSLCSTMTTSIYDFSSDELRFDIKNNYKLIPLHTLTPDVIANSGGLLNTYLPTDDKITLNAKAGFSADAYSYQYRLQNETTWKNIDASLFNMDKLSIDAKDLFPTDFNDQVGKNIEFRVVSCFENGEYQSWSEPRILKIIESSSHILSTSVTPTKCFDSTDGTLTMTFDELMSAGETMKGSLVNTVNNAAVPFNFPVDALQNSTTVIVENLPSGKYRLDLAGTFKGDATYADAPQHSVSFEITNPTPVQFSLTSKTDVFCFKGADGKIAISANGGQNSYQYAVTGDNGLTIDWTNFDNGVNSSINNLSAGTYQIKVRDANLCVAKESGSEKVFTVQITQPNAAIALSETEIKEPSGYGLSNGYISLRVIGGTPNTDGSYNYEWHKDAPTGALISSGITTDAAINPFTIKLDGLPAGKYYLTVKDKNYANATSELGSCGIITQEFVVTEPLPLVVVINVTKIISCNISNKYDYKADQNNNGVPDEAENGALEAVVTGGVGTYSYQWQKNVSSAFQDIPGANASTLNQLTEGTYKILVKDVNNNSTELEQVFNFPVPLNISLSANTIKCNSLNEGEVSVTVTGGLAPYTYKWSTSAITSTVKGLSAGGYFVMVQDANMCSISGSVIIEQPGQMKIDDVSIQNPICTGTATGAIQIKASGGVAPYTIAWSNGKTGESLTDLQAGTYVVTFTDVNGCSASREYTLTDPEKLTFDLGRDITLCIGDAQNYDIKIEDPGATYQWLNGGGEVISATSKVSLSAAGTYTAIVTSSNGCIATDEITVKGSLEVLKPEFLITTHAYIDYTVKLVNTSTIKPEQVEWVIPNTSDIQVISKNDEYVELKFLRLGAYEIGLKGMQGACEKTFFKNIIVEENTNGVIEAPTAISNIQEFIVAPNPNSGVYKVSVKLNKEAGIKLRIMDLMGHESYPANSQPKSTAFEVPFNYTLIPGIYLVILETGSENQVRKMIVK